MHTVFIDGDQGTTGLRVADRLRPRAELTLLTLPEAERKSLPARVRMAREADVTILCLPDDASRELVAALGEGEARVIDASTAHRTDPRFVYGFPELARGRAEEIARGRRVAVPGCHAGGCVALLKPLMAAGLLAPGAPLCLTSFTGYSGGGKKMIAQYEAADRPPELRAPRPYASGQTHKHLPEIVSVCGLQAPPVFQPVVCDFYSGMLVSLPLDARLTAKPLAPRELSDLYAAFYAGGAAVTVLPPNAEATVDPLRLAGTDGMELLVTGNADRMIAYARFDNLGKGASGAAIQCMNLMLGLPETAGLVLPTEGANP